MTLDKALGFALDYSKFVATLWNYYTVVVLAFLGWIITLRTKDVLFELSLRLLLIRSFIAISLMFAVIIKHNHAKLVDLLHLVGALALIEAGHDQRLSAAFLRLTNVEENARFLMQTLYFALPVSVLATCCITWFLTRSKAPPLLTDDSAK